MSLFDYALQLSKFARTEDVKLILLVINVFKDYLLSTELQKTEVRPLQRKLETFKRLTAEFCEITEPLEAYFKYMNSLIVKIREFPDLDWTVSKKWIQEKVEKFAVDKVFDAQPIIIEYVPASHADGWYDQRRRDHPLLRILQSAEEHGEPPA